MNGNNDESRGGAEEEIYQGARPRGASALTWARRALVVGVPMVILGLVLASGLFLGWARRIGTLFLVGFWLWIALSLATVILIVVQVVQAIREGRLGYTTQFNAYPNLPQIDPETGVIVRHAGEPLVTSKELNTRRQTPPSGRGTRST